MRSRRKSPASSATPSADGTLRRRADGQLPGARLSATTRRRSATAGVRSPATRTTGARFRSRARRARRTSPTVPMPTDTYSVPQNLGYSVNGIERKRTNGQLTLQFAPVDALTATLDYTYSENKIQTAAQRAVGVVQLRSVGQQLDRRSGGGPARSTPRRSPGATSDLSMGGAKFATKNENKSLGFNLAWDVTDRLGFELDYHDSTRRIRRRQPVRLERRARCRRLLSRHHHGRLQPRLPGHAAWCCRPARPASTPSQMMVTGSSFRNSYMKAEIEQAQLDGNFDFTEDSRLDFGVALTEVNNRSAFSQRAARHLGRRAPMRRTTRTTCGSATRVRQYFDNIGGSSSNRTCSTSSSPWDFETVRSIAAELRGDRTAIARTRTFTHRPSRQGGIAERLRAVQPRLRHGDADARGAGRALREDRRHLERAGAAPPRHQLGGQQRVLGRRLGSPDFTTLDGELRLRAAEHRLRLRSHGQHEAARQLRARPSAVRAGATSRADRRSTSWCASTAAPARRAIRA